MVYDRLTTRTLKDVSRLGMIWQTGWSEKKTDILSELVRDTIFETKFDPHDTLWLDHYHLVMFYADLIARIRACMLRAWIFISTLSGWSRTLIVFALTAIWEKPYALWIWIVDSNLHWKWLWLIEFEWFPFNILYNILIRHNAIEHISLHEYTNILFNSNQYIFKWDCTRQTHKVNSMSLFSKIIAISIWREREL